MSGFYIKLHFRFVFLKFVSIFKFYSLNHSSINLKVHLNYIIYDYYSKNFLFMLKKILLNILIIFSLSYPQTSNLSNYRKEYTQLRHQILNAQRQKNFLKAFELYDRAFKLVKDDNKDNLYDLKMVISENYMLIGDLKTTEKLLLETYNYFSKNKLIETRPYIIGRLGSFYRTKGEFRKSISYFKNVINLVEPTNDKTYLGQLYDNLAQTYQKINNDDSTLFYYNKALSTLLNYKNTYQYATVCFNLAKFESAKFHLKEAEYLFNESQKYFLQAGFPELQINSLAHLTSILIRTNKFNKALTNIELIKTHSSHNNSPVLILAYQLEIEYYLKTNQFDRLRISLEKYNRVSDSVRKDENSNNIRLFSERIKKERDILNSQQTQIAIQQSALKYTYWILFLLLLLSIVLIVAYRNKQKSNKKLNEINTELEFANQKLNAFFEQTDHLIKILDQKGEILFWNRKNQEISHISETEAVNQPYNQIFPKYVINDKNLDYYFKSLNNFIKTNHNSNNQGNLNLEYNVFLYNNHYHTFCDTIFRLSLKDKDFIGIIGRDITLQKENEEKLVEAKEKAEKADRLKTDFLAQMSHEIRTPLNLILSYSGFLEEHLSDVNDDIVKSSFESINRGASRIIRTIDLILNVSEIQAGLYNFQPQLIPLCEKIITPLIKDFKKITGSKNLELILKKSTENCIVYCDEYSLTHIIENLLDNAVKFTQEGFIKISLAENDNFVILEIEDSGVGMSSEFLENLFRPFVQEEQGYTRKYEGNGLGLSLVKQYCDINKIVIECFSEKNRGTTFRLKIPAI